MADGSSGFVFFAAAFLLPFLRLKMLLNFKKLEASDGTIVVCSFTLT